MGKYLRNCRRAVVVNTVGAYGSGERQNRLPGFVLVTSAAELVSYLRPHQFAGNIRVLYQPNADMVEQFPALCALVYECRDIVFAVDEVWNFQRPNWSPNEFRMMMLQGRIRGHILLYTAQFPQLVDERLLSCSTEMHIGRLQNALDVRKVSTFFPSAAAVAERMPALPDRRFLQIKNSGAWEEN